MKDLVEVIAKALVDNPDEVVVTEKVNGKNITVELHVAPADILRLMLKLFEEWVFERTPILNICVYRPILLQK